MKALVLGFLSGSIPWGYVIAKLKGIDLRKMGSGNIGATNVYRALGASYALLTLFLDMLKALLPALLLGDEAGFGAVIGHAFTPWLGFRGGKSAACLAGFVLALALKGHAELAVLYFLIFFGSFALTRISSLSNLLASLTAFWYALFVSFNPWLLASVVLVWVRHKENIKRLLKSEEKPLKI